MIMPCRTERILQRGADRVHRRGAAFAHALGAVVRKGRRRFDMAVEQSGMFIAVIGV